MYSLNISSVKSSLNICFVLFVQGEGLKEGSRRVDFVITLGDGECRPVYLADNHVDCRPPRHRPNKHVDDTLCDDDMLSMHVSD